MNSQYYTENFNGKLYSMMIYGDRKYRYDINRKSFIATCCSTKNNCINFSIKNSLYCLYHEDDCDFKSGMLSDIGYQTEEYIKNYLLSSGYFESVINIGKYNAKADLIFRLKTKINNGDFNFYSIQIKTLSYSKDRDNYRIKISGYDSKMPIIGVDQERKIFLCLNRESLSSDNMIFKSVNNQKENKKFLFNGVEDFSNGYSFLQLILYYCQYAPVFDSSNIPEPQLKEIEMIIRLKIECEKYGYSFKDNIIQNSPVDCFINGYNVQLKYCEYSRDGIVTFNLSQTKDGIRSNPYCEEDNIDYFILSTRDKFYIFPINILIFMGIIKSNDCDGKISLNVGNEWTETFYNKFEYIRKSPLLHEYIFKDQVLSYLINLTRFNFIVVIIDLSINLIKVNKILTKVYCRSSSDGNSVYYNPDLLKNVFQFIFLSPGFGFIKNDNITIQNSYIYSFNQYKKVFAERTHISLPVMGNNFYRNKNVYTGLNNYRYFYYPELIGESRIDIISDDYSSNDNILQIDIKTGLPIAIYKEIKIASEMTGVNQSDISKCCSDLRRTAGGYGWIIFRKYIKDKMTDKDEIENFIKEMYDYTKNLYLISKNNDTTVKKTKEIVQLTMDGNLVMKYKTGAEASRLTGINNGHISNCCCGTRNNAGGYKWEFAEKYFQKIQKQQYINISGEL